MMFQQKSIWILSNRKPDLVPAVAPKKPQNPMKTATKLLSRDQLPRHHCHHLPHALGALRWETLGTEWLSGGFTARTHPALQQDTRPMLCQERRGHGSALTDGPALGLVF